MNGLKYAVLSLAVLACFDGSAKRKNKKAKKAETVRVDTCSVDTFSYAMGMANTQGLKNCHQPYERGHRLYGKLHRRF